MPNEPTYVGLKRINITIEGPLHTVAKARAKQLGFSDGLSGYIARLLNLELKSDGEQVLNAPRRFTAPNNKKKVRRVHSKS